MMQQMLLGYGPSGVDVEDVFSVDLYTGNGSTGQSINNGIDLSGEGGLVWIKGRDIAYDHLLFDTERGVRKKIAANTQYAEGTANSGHSLTSFNSNGFTLGGQWFGENTNNQSYVGWTFRKASKFFDVVTYSGNSTAGRTISHNLGAVPGMMWIKSINANLNWQVYHTSMGNNKSKPLNNRDAATTSSGFWNGTTPTDSVFTLGSNQNVNATGNNYVAYLFAEDTSKLIKCGGYTGNGTASNTITTGFETQFLIVNHTTFTNHDYEVYDTTRGMVATSSHRLEVNSTDVEVDTSSHNFYSTSTGFVANNRFNVSGREYMYMAIAAP